MTTAAIWVEGELVVHIDQGEPIPHKGDTVYLEKGSHRGFYKVIQVVFSFRTLAYSDGATFNKVEVHVKKLPE